MGDKKVSRIRIPVDGTVEGGGGSKWLVFPPPPPPPPPAAAAVEVVMVAAVEVLVVMEEAEFGGIKGFGRLRVEVVMTLEAHLREPIPVS